jgi:hypothetical protein
MHMSLYLGGVLAAGLVLAATGWWRKAFAVFALRPGRMTVQRLKLCVSEPADVARVNSILSSFAGGFNAMITSPSPNAWRGYCEALPSLLTSFAHEGAAMGYTVRRLFRYRPAEFAVSLL